MNPHPRRHLLDGPVQWALATTLAGCALLGCRANPSPPTRKVPALKSYPVVGIVRAVDERAGVLTLRHEAIPGYMDAMTMPFDVAAPADRNLLNDIRPGDKIEATLKVEGDGATLNGLEILEYAQAPPDASAPTSPNILRPGQPVPDFTLTTQDGEPRSLSSYRGEVVILTFIYTRCPLPNYCPLMDRKFAELAGLLQGVPSRASRVRLLSLSFDPEHDTPEVLKAHAARMGAKPPLWSFAVASHDELAKVAPALGLSYGPARGEVIHSLSTAVIGPDGRLVRLELGSNWTPAALLAEVSRLLRPAANSAQQPEPTH